MRNYIGNNNEINKKKYKKSLPPKLNPDAGNVEHNIDMFNRASSGDANLSSAAGMNGMVESYDRDSLIARITEFGKHYNFDKYTDAQLNAMLNRLVDAENYRKRVLPIHQDKINIQSDRHIMNDDPSYNFDDPEREGEYRVENLREALNRLDHYCIDNDKTFYDLRSLYENIQHQLTPQEKQELKKLVDTTNDPDAIKAYIDSKDPQKKNEELDEDLNFNSPFPTWNDAYDLFQEVVDKYFPDEDKINMEIENLRLKYEGNKEFDYAYEQWLNSGEDDIEDEEEEDQLITATWADETDVDFDESLNEGVFDTLKAKRQARLDKIDAKKRAEDPLYDRMRRYSLGEPSQEDDPKLHPELDPRNFIYDRKFQSQKDRFGNPRKVPDNVISVVIKSNVEAISTDAFKDHKNLKEVRFEGKTLMIYPRAFMNCTSLTYIELPESLHTIQSEAFKNCTSLRWIKFQANQLSLDNNAFEGCKSLNLKAILQKYSYEVDQERTKLFNSYKFNTIIYRKKKKSVDESMKDMDSLLLLQSLLNQYPDISIEDEDYLNSLSYSDLAKEIKNRGWEDVLNENLNEDTVKQGNKWVNKGKEGTHGKFKTKKAADAQRKAMFANGYKGESLKEDISDDNYSEVQVGDTVYHKDYGEGTVKKFNYKSTPSQEDTIYVTFSKDLYGNEFDKKVNRIFPFPRAFKLGWLQWLNHPDSTELNDLDIQYTDVDFDESLNESSYYIHSQQDLDDARADLSKRFNDFRASRLPKSDYRYKQLLKDEKDLEKKANEFTASQKGQEIVTKAKLSKLITKLTGLVPIKTATTSIRGYRPVTGGSFELERYTYDKDITVRFYRNQQVVPELMNKLNDLGYRARYYSDNTKDTLQVSIFKDNFITPDWADETDVDFDESLKLKESSPVNYKKKISLIREIDKGIPYSMRYKEADIVNDYDNDELILYWVTEDPFTKDELQEFAFHATECCHDMYDDIVQIALTYRGISKGFNSDDNLGKLIWIDAAGEWTDEDWDAYVNHMKKVGVDVQANDLIAADWEDSTDFNFDESLKLKKKRR